MVSRWAATFSLPVVPSPYWHAVPSRLPVPGGGRVNGVATVELPHVRSWAKASDEIKGENDMVPAVMEFVVGQVGCEADVSWHAPVLQLHAATPY